MPNHPPRILVTGAGGQLGRLVLAELLATLAPSQVVATVRSGAAAASLAATRVEVRIADYDRPETLDAAFAGVDRLLLVSSNEVGRRVAQHRNAIDAAKRANVGLLAYTSILRADSSPLALAAEHRESEALLRASGLPHALLRNGWYTENDMAAVPAALAHGALLGSSGDGRISWAARADYAAAAAAVLRSGGEHAGRVYELAGDGAHTRAELAAEVARQSGKPVVYRDLPEAEFASALTGMGLPAGLAGAIADADAGAAKGGLFDDGQQLRALIGRPTTPLATSVREALRAS